MTLDHIARYDCAGAVHFSQWGCRQSSGALRLVRDRLRREGIPLLVLDGDCVDPVNLQLGPLRTRVEAFVGMVRALADELGEDLIVPEEPQIVGALGAALAARDGTDKNENHRD